MTNWCYGDDWLCQRAGRAWPIERLAEMLGKSCRAILDRFPEAGRPRAVTEQEVQAIEALLPGRSVKVVGAILGFSPEEIASIAHRHDLLNDYDEPENHRTTLDLALIAELHSRDMEHAEIARLAGRTVHSVRTTIRRQLGLSYEAAQPYTQYEDGILREMSLQKHTSAAIARRVGRTANSVRARRAYLAQDRSRTKPKFYTHAEDARIAELTSDGMSAAAIGKLLGRTRSAINNRRQFLKNNPGT